MLFSPRGRHCAPKPSGSKPKHLRQPPPGPSITARLGVTVGLGAMVVGLVPAGAQTYEVTSGDALSVIAERYGVSTDALAEANGITNHNIIVVGDVLSIPGTVSTTTGPSAAIHEHTVRPGETLSDLAYDHDVSIAEVLAWNPQLADRPVWVDEIVLIGGSSSSSSGSTSGSSQGSSPPAAPSSAGVTHTIVAGDTLSEIASTHGVTLSRLLEANDITSGAVLRVGDTLSVPSESDSLPAALVRSPAKLALMPIFDEMAATYGIPPELLKALAWFESGWNNTVTSSADAIGIGQVLPITAQFISDDLLGKPLDPYVPRDNVELSAAYLRYLLAETGDQRLAVAAYYQGLTAVRRHGIFRSSEFYVNGILALQERFR